ncbi:hypothetical protein SDC9_188299 [bioreactor metagenome]|uniref:Uncharacterized protein n=1 Tax=bioreactor metagenome TaxID=1076179 RepID=A0A645HPJ3_9ZZZZ
MADKDFGDRTNMWFWMMIKSLGLYLLTDSVFDNLGYEGRLDNTDKVKDIVNAFLCRGYNANGAGGLFTVNDTNKDMRDVEIWYQMCMFLDNLL